MNCDFATACETQAGIRAFIEQAAEFMAQAGFASSKVTGDRPQLAVHNWFVVLETEALRRLRVKESDAKPKALDAPKKQVSTTDLS